MLQVVIVQWGGEWFSTAPLKWYHWFACLGFGLGTLVWGQIVNYIPIKCRPNNSAVGSGEATTDNPLHLDSEDTTPGEKRSEEKSDHMSSAALQDPSPANDSKVATTPSLLRHPFDRTKGVPKTSNDCNTAVALVEVDSNPSPSSSVLISASKTADASNAI
uniref:Cation-transporting P-type ATPase C-terminal domain-containing protein n=1 Tax=Panagrolaimus sp. ES5 TaxID=591445 RepID=A0AC34GF15_9BILA